MRYFTLCFCSLLAPLWAHAQQPDTTRTPADTAQVQQLSYFGTAITYGQLVLELRRLVTLPMPPDTATTDSPDAGIQRLEIDGLVVDETLTKVGRDFYDVFFRLWQPPKDAINFTIAVQEQPAPGTGTIVSVLVNDELVFQSRLQPQLEYVETAAQQAVFLAFRQLERGEVEVVY